MKTMKNFMAITAVALIFAAILVGSCSAQIPTDYLKVKGKVIGAKTTDIQVFEYDEVECMWEVIYDQEKKSNYSLRLATDKEYKILFRANHGYVKTINIQPGNPGLWIEMLDIDFNKINNLTANMYQNDNSDGYNIDVVPIVYANLDE